MDSVVACIGRVGVYYPKGVKIGTEGGSWEETSRARTSSTPLNLGRTEYEERKDI